MFSRSPPPSRYRRRTSSAANFRLVENEQVDQAAATFYNFHQPNFQTLHCRCCSMSTNDLLSPTLNNNFEMDSSSDCHNQHHRNSNENLNSCWQTTFDDQEDDETSSKIFLQHQQRRIDRRSNSSRTPSIVSTLSSPNILLLGNGQAGDYHQQQQQPSSMMNQENGNRLRERLAASIAGLKELDILREKHKRMVEEVKMQLKFTNSTAADTLHQRHQSNLDQQYSNHATNNNNNNAPRSPSPAELSSNISHRSSLSMDSGVCLSLTSDPTSINGHHGGYRFMTSNNYYPHHHHHHQRRLSTDSVNNGSFHHQQHQNNYLNPIRKSSWTMSSQNAIYDHSLAANANNSVAQNSDDEGCYTMQQQQHNGYNNSLTSITAALAAAEATVAAPRTSAAAFRYRRRLENGSANGNGSSAVPPSRPRSLYNCYPEENTVTVEAAPPLSPRQFSNPPPPTSIAASSIVNGPSSTHMRLLRRTSVQYRPQIATIVANLPESKSINVLNQYSNHHSDQSTAAATNVVVCRRRPNGQRSSNVDPVFRASRVFIDTLPENEILLDPYTDFRQNNVSLRPRRYETRRPRPTSMAVPPSVSTPMLTSGVHYHSNINNYSPPSSSSSSSQSNRLRKQNSSLDLQFDHSPRQNIQNNQQDDWRRATASSSFSWDEAKKLLDPQFSSSSSSTTLVRQHSIQSTQSNGHHKNAGSPPPPSKSDRKKSPHRKNQPILSENNLINVSIINTGDSTSSASSICGGVTTTSSIDGSDHNNILINGHTINGTNQDDHKSISRSISSQSSDSNKSRRNKEKTWRESPQL